MKIEIEVTDLNLRPLSDDQLAALRAAIGYPRATIVENRKPIGGRAITHVVQTAKEVFGVAPVKGKMT